MKKLILAFAFAGFAAAPALAADMASFSAADANADGIVTMEEGNAVGANWTEEQFKAADTNGNGSLSEAEYNAATGQ
ncbi:MAG: hypothetical protein R3D32_02660 [Nitratireductor sp.]